MNKLMLIIREALMDLRADLMHECDHTRVEADAYIVRVGATRGFTMSAYRYNNKVVAYLD